MVHFPRAHLCESVPPTHGPHHFQAAMQLGSDKLGISHGYLLTCFREWNFLLIFLFGNALLNGRQAAKNTRITENAQQLRGLALTAMPENTWKVIPGRCVSLLTV